VPEEDGMNLNKEPIYQQLTRILRQRIADGDFHPGEQFLTEKNICESYKVSRATAGKALTTLVAERILEFKTGIGTFVKEQSPPQDLQSLISFTVMAEELGKVPGTELLVFKKLKAADVEETVLNSLDCGVKEDLFYCERIRLLDGKPSLLDRRHIRAEFCPGLLPENAKGSLIRFWTENCGLVLESTEQFIRAVKLDESESRKLDTSEGDCALRLSSIGFLDDGRPLWYEDSLFPGDRYVIRNRLSNLKGSLPARRMFVGGA
jgi:DNA-binding GntR family transcriptional regulator